MILTFEQEGRFPTEDLVTTVYIYPTSTWENVLCTMAYPILFIN